MTKRLLLALFATTLLISSGCGMFSKKGERPPKENPAIAADVEETFRRRWMEKRLSELAAQGAEPNAARTQAEKEFSERYGFPVRKK
ncbi:MAG: hypothetical protein V4773_10250 [Verrucomicrobiota bacterium]